VSSCIAGQQDLGGQASTTEFADEVIRRVRTKIDVWSA